MLNKWSIEKNATNHTHRKTNQTIPQNREAYQGTIPAGINPSGAITGFWGDANGATHGFLRTP